MSTHLGDIGLQRGGVQLGLSVGFSPPVPPAAPPAPPSGIRASSGSAGGPPRLPVVRLMGVELQAVTEKQAIDHILDEIALGRGGAVVTPNLDIVRRCTKDLPFAALVSESEVVVADGMPLVWASRLQGTPLPQRVAGSDLIKSLSAEAARRGRSIFLLGGSPGTAEGAAAVLKANSPGLSVVGTYCPPLGFEEKPHEISRLVSTIQNARPDIVWVALGSPKQELLIDRIREILPGTWWLGVGVSFSFLTGHVRRAPRWLQKIGLEWTHRLYQEPRRLFKRYVMVGIPFASRLFASALSHRFTAERGAMEGHRYRGRNRPHNGHRSLARLENAPLPQSETQILGDPNADSGILSLPGSPTARTTLNVPRADLATRRSLSRLKSVILLGGRVRETPLTLSINRSLLDLPLDDSNTLLSHWLTHASDLANFAGLGQLAVRVMVDHKGPEPLIGNANYAGPLTVERDRSSYRGTGGLLADITSEYDDDDYILVANANQIMLDPLHAIAAALDHKRGDVNLVSHRDGTATTLMLLSVKTLRDVSDVGYVDMKEQALPRIAGQFAVRVVHCRQPTGLPIRTLENYINGLKQYHRRLQHGRARKNPLGEDFGRHFAIVEPGAQVPKSAYLHDSVVLRDAIVGSGAAVIRSLVCGGAAIPADSQVIDQMRTRTLLR